MKGFTEKRAAIYGAFSSGLQFEAITARLLSKSVITPFQSEVTPPAAYVG